jgi:hypothetical protein
MTWTPRSGRWALLALVIGAVAVLGSACSSSASPSSVSVTKAEVIGTWTDRQGLWIVLTGSGDSYMDPAMDHQTHVAFHEGRALP